MGKWNCVSCGLNLEDKRHLAEFPLENITLYCRDCAKKLKDATIKCVHCDQTVRAYKAVQGKFCSPICETDYYAMQMEERPLDR